MKLTEIKEKLNDLSKSELVKIIVELYQKSPENIELIGSKFNSDYEKIAFEKYKKQIIDEFFPERGDGKLRYSNMRKALKNFKDISKNPKFIAELMMIHVEYGVKFTNEYGDIDEKFYNNIAGMYSKLLDYLNKNDIISDYKKRCYEIYEKTNNIGWGFHDEMGELYYEYCE